MSAEEAILEQIRERTEPTPDGVQDGTGNLWTGNRRLRSDARKKHTDYTKLDVETLIPELERSGEIVTWHGLLAPATEEHVRALIQNECEVADISRSLLLGKLNTVKAELEGSA